MQLLKLVNLVKTATLILYSNKKEVVIMTNLIIMRSCSEYHLFTHYPARALHRITVGCRRPLPTRTRTVVRTSTTTYSHARSMAGFSFRCVAAVPVTILEILCNTGLWRPGLAASADFRFNNPGLRTSTYEQIIVYGHGLIPWCVTFAVKR